LQTIIKTNNHLDEGRADYVFFPLSHVFRQSNEVSQRGLELALKCLFILLSHGWGKGIPKELGLQLLILLTFTAGGTLTKAQGSSEETSEELRVIAFRDLASLFESFSRSAYAASLSEAANFPTLGQVVSVVLEGITSGQSSQVQLSASLALGAIHDCIRDKEALASFLPGTVSALTKALQRETRSKRPWRVFEANIKLLSKVLLALLDDVQVNSLVKHERVTKKTSDFKVSLSESWLKATASQVKIALASVVKLHDHDRAEVRCALLQLCEAIVERCQQSLAECTPLMITTIIQVSAAESDGSNKEGKDILSRLVISNEAVLDAIKSNLHTWISALPRIFQSNDDRAKQKTVRQLAIAYDVFSELDAGLPLLGDMITSTLRDTVAAVIAFSTAQGGVIESSESVQDLIHKGTNQTSDSFQPVMIAHKSQQEPLSQLQLLLEQLGEAGSAKRMARDLLDVMQTSSGDQALASFWLTLSLVRKPLSTETAIDKLIDLDLSTHTWAGVLEELYSYSLAMLLTPWQDQQQDWRMQSLALETVALQATHLKADFRTELVEALFPVVHLIGSPNPLLQQHAITCLNIIADCCGYSSASDLVIGNVDYLVNAVALKLNTFDISPQAPQVLRMMIKLAGPALLPYLDDLVDSIFAALDNFHGYPKLVQLLFAVLMDIVGEGSKSDALKTSQELHSSHRKTPYRPRTIAEVAEILRDVRRRDEQDDESVDRAARVSAPHEPWKGLSDTDTTDQDPHSDTSPTTDNADSDNTALAPAPSAPTKTYKLLHSILRLTQNYLTHASPTLRRDLLALTSTAAAPLAHNEDLFLPLM
jgi:TELO2-interacting protein 1